MWAGSWKTVVEYLAGQLGIADASCVKRYTDRTMTAYEHSWQVRQAHGFRVFDDAEVSEEFRQFLDGRAWTHAEGQGALFTHGVGWLRRARVLLPGSQCSSGPAASSPWPKSPPPAPSPL